MKKIKLIALDMDGTLLNDDGVVSPYTHDIIQQALAQGTEVVLSTGRPLPMCSTFAEELKLPSYIITSNGAEIWTVNHELIDRHPLEVEQIKRLWQLGYERNLHMWIVATDQVFVNRQRPENFEDHVWLKLGYGNLTEKVKRDLLSDLEHIEEIEITNSSLTNLEVNRAGVNKANAINFICKRLNISMEEVMAIGDSLNDLKMIEQAGIGVAVKNAQQLIIESADYVTETNNDNGVAKAIEKYVLD
ncbi:Cof-type HAD-IIB family hydrolase [Pseudogracilibacillus sp. SE30717A]|uniref:Cof-type HAD-IIB family hydrolase n=1 Tax=Pseudogracilibacillus sp. SE30717A TaxID=3098293 RepID=UPI00300E49E5